MWDRNLFIVLGVIRVVGGELLAFWIIEGMERRWIEVVRRCKFIDLWMSECGVGCVEYGKESWGR